MSVELLRVNSEYEKPIVMSFEDYRVLCDEVDDFRKIGIQSADTYKSAVLESQDNLLETPRGLIPLFASIKSEKMYCEERCKKMLGRDNVYLLALPLHLLQELAQDKDITLPSDAGFIIENFSDDASKEASSLPSRFANENISVKEFINTDLEAFPGHESAWMAAYSVIPGSDNGEKVFSSGGEFSEEIVSSWVEMRKQLGLEVEPGPNSTGVFYFSNDTLRNRPDVIEGLWDVSSFGFGEKLGKDHPLSMEFNREFFDQQVTAETAMTAVYIENGDPQCFSFISPNFNDNDWINCESKKMQDFFKEAKDNGRVPLHWFELISKGERGMGHADKVLQEFMQLAAQSGYDFQVFFESTNLSSLYIPDIVREQIKKTDGLSLREDVRMIGKLNYYAILT